MNQQISPIVDMILQISCEIFAQGRTNHLSRMIQRFEKTKGVASRLQIQLL